MIGVYLVACKYLGVCIRKHDECLSHHLAELNGDSDDKVLQEKETLLLTVEALKAQLEEQTRLCKEQVRQDKV